MPIVEFCKAAVAVVEKNSSIVDAARLMRESHVGDVVVCENEDGVPKPIGVLTDRDIVVGVIAMDIPVEKVRVEDVMTPALVSVNLNAGVYETIQLMEAYGVRRVPVVNDDGGLVGIVSSGDLMELLSQEVLALSRLPVRQKEKEQEIRL